MSLNKGQSHWTGAAVGTNGGATLTVPAPAVTGYKNVVMSVQASGDAAALLTVESPANTVLMKIRYAAAFHDTITFPDGALRGAVDQAVVVKVSASTSNSEVNAQGFIQG